MELDSIVPWGRSLREYREMFALTDQDLRKRILGCGDGPASFNVELTAMGGDVLSVDPIYQFSADQIGARIEQVYPQVMGQVALHQDDFVWTSIPDVAALGTLRMDAMRAFLADYASAEPETRYRHMALPDLPLADGAFDLALCSHFLFLYSEHVDQAQHLASMLELCRVAREVRVYPLMAIGNNQESPHLRPVMAALTARGIAVSLVPVAYEFQRGATHMLVATRR